MIALSPRFATLLILVASAHAAFVPQRHISQAPFHTRSHPDVPSRLYDSTLNTFRNFPLFFRRHATPTKAPGKKAKHKSLKTLAPIPESAKPKSAKASSNPPAENNVAAGHGRHTPGEHHRDNKGDKHRKSGGRKSEGHRHKGHKPGHHKGHKDKEKRSIVKDFENRRVNSRLFGRLNESVRNHSMNKKDVIFEGRHVDGRRHARDHDHDHDHDRDHDHDHYHGHDHVHEHRHRDLEIDVGEGENGSDVEMVVRRDPGGDYHHQHHLRSEDDPSLLEAEVNLKRSHESRGHHGHRHHIKKEAVTESGIRHPLVIHDVGHENLGKGVTYHVHGRRQHHRRISQYIRVRHYDHDHDHDHVHNDHVHVHEHKHRRRAVNPGLGARSCGEHKQAYSHGRRDHSGVPGSISITSPTIDHKAVKIANLVIADIASVTSTTPSNASFVLNASNDTQTQVFLVAQDSPPNSEVVKVSFHVPVYDAATIKDVPYCVTYDPKPAGPGPLTVLPCNKSSDHLSQVFEYTPTTGSVRPMWYSQADSGANGTGSASAANQDQARLPIPDEDNVTAANATAANVTAANATPADSISSLNSTSVPVSGDVSYSPSNGTLSSDSPAPPRTVALVFQPDHPEEPEAAAENDPDSGMEDPNAMPGEQDSAYKYENVTSFYPQANAPDNTTTSTMTTTTTTSATTTMNAAAALVASTTSTTDALSTASTGAPSAADVTSTTSTNTVTPTSSSPTGASAQSTGTARAIDAAAPYEYMFTTKASK